MTDHILCRTVRTAFRAHPDTERARDCQNGQFAVKHLEAEPQLS